MSEHGYPRYPNIKVKLIGQNGNAFNLLGICANAMRKAKLSEEIQKEFMDEAQSGDYDNLLRTCMKWFDVH